MNVFTDQEYTEYKKFKREVLREIEDADIEEDEEYPIALFLVDKQNEPRIITIEDVEDEFEEVTDETELTEIIEEIFPQLVKSNDSKFFSLVFPGYHQYDDLDIVVVLFGALFNAEMLYAEKTLDKTEGTIQLQPWQKEDVLEYPEIMSEYRKAITYQG